VSPTAHDAATKVPRSTGSLLHGGSHGSMPGRRASAQSPVGCVRRVLPDAPDTRRRGDSNPDV